MNGHYTSHYLAEILRDLFFDESSGVLEVKSPAGRSITLHFERGMLYFGEGTEPNDNFDSFLAASGLLPASTLAKLKTSTASPLDMAARMVAKQVLAKEALSPVIRSLVESCVIGAFSWPSGSQEFQAREPIAGFFEPDILFTFECILKGIGKMSHFDPLREILLKLPGRLKLSEKVFLPVHRLALKPHHGYILSRIDGSMRLEEIAMVMPPGEEEESLRFIYGLAVLGIVEFTPPVNQGSFSLREIVQGHQESTSREEREVALIKETADRILGQGNAEVLGVAPDAPLHAVQQAFEHAKGRFRRSRFSERVREKYKKELGLIENRFTEAFLKLQVERLERAGHKRPGEIPIAEINPDELVVRREMVKTEAQASHDESIRLAERYFQKAREYHKDKDYHNTIQFCQLAIKFNAEAAPYHALMADALCKNPNAKWQKLAEVALSRACDLDPWNAEYHVSLGMFYKSQGLDIRARRQFEKALEILPTHSEAKAALKARKR